MYKKQAEKITGKKKVRYEFGTLGENNRAYPLYIKEQLTPTFLEKIENKQNEGKNYKYFIVYRVELISFEHEGEYYNVPYKTKTLTKNSALLKEVANILAKDSGMTTEEYIAEYYNK